MASCGSSPIHKKDSVTQIETCFWMLDFVNTLVLEAVDRSNRNNAKSSWVADPSLPQGWRSYVPGLNKIMYYSPCGRLFTSRLQVDKFLGVFTRVADTEILPKEQGPKITKKLGRPKSEKVLQEKKELKP